MPHSSEAVLLREAVTLEYSVVRNDSQFLDTGLGHEHAIERISMYVRQTTGRQSMLYSFVNSFPSESSFIMYNWRGLGLSIRRQLRSRWRITGHLDYSGERESMGCCRFVPSLAPGQRRDLRCLWKRPACCHARCKPLRINTATLQYQVVAPGMLHYRPRRPIVFLVHRTSLMKTRSSAVRRYGMPA
jgi:hypothetical protein